MKFMFLLLLNVSHFKLELNAYGLFVDVFKLTETN